MLKLDKESLWVIYSRHVYCNDVIRQRSTLEEINRIDRQNNAHKANRIHKALAQGEQHTMATFEACQRWYDDLSEEDLDESARRCKREYSEDADFDAIAREASESARNRGQRW